MIALLTIPFLTCIVLTLIHVYFGSFVLRRGILFVDLALAQWAALGYLVGHWAHVESALGLFGLAFGFTVLAAGILSWLSPHFQETNLQEAVIGVMYISGTAIATGLISTTGMEGHHLKDMLAGHLLFVTWPELAFATALYGVIALSLLWLHRRFLDHGSRLWDFVFYVLFGAVVTSSVKMVGLLMVFALLVLPLLAVIRFVPNYWHQVRYGWAIGIGSSILGLAMSVALDLPPSLSVILSLCVVWVLGQCLLTRLNTPR